MIEESIKAKLFSKKSIERRKAIKDIRKQKLIALSGDLLDAYLKEKKDVRSWENQMEMILTLGIVEYKPALSIIEPIILSNNPHDMITYASAQTYVRLKRKSLHDSQPVLYLLEFGGLSLVDGALTPLAYDKMMPPKDEIIELIRLSWDMHKHKDRIGYENNYCDPRYGLAAACAGWERELTTTFLKHCLLTAGNDSSLKHVAESALKGKAVTLR